MSKDTLEEDSEDIKTSAFLNFEIFSLSTKIKE
jgi:hypothetical protein